MQVAKYQRNAAMLIGLSASAHQRDLERLFSLYIDGKKMMKINDIVDTGSSPVYLRAVLDIKDS